MKKIGIIGGLGPESTIDYYKRITSFFHHYNQSLSTPEIIIYSVDLAEVFQLVEAQRWELLTALLVDRLASLRDAGADFAAISANTPHIVFDQVQARSPLPLISIVEVTLAAAQRLGVGRIGLLGTRLTMQANFYGERFAREGITVVVPEEPDQLFIEEKLLTEIELGIMREETRTALGDVIRRMQERHGIEAAILGCTELPLILDDKDANVPLLNTTALHVEEICRQCLE
ncbi:aspartate racemase [Geobacter sulfurreducens]|nr:aspartate racemase [Geobacter sulfurreducens]